MSPSQNNGVNHKPRVVRFTIYRKMMLGFAVIILLMIIANVYVLFELYSVTKTTEMTLTSNVRSIDLAKQIQAILFEEERYARKYFISLDTAYFTLFNDQSKRVEPYINAVIAAETKQPELELINRVREGHDWLLTAIREEHDSVRTPAVNEPNINARVHSDSLEAYQASLDQFIRLNQISISNSMANVGTAMIRSSNVAYLLTVGALLVALTVALFIASTITKPIGILIKGTDRIARGAFDPISVSSRDEIALLTTAVNDMSGKLRRVNELKTELMHHLSHELRTPLQAMLSAQDLLAQHKVGPLTNEQARLLNSIKEGISKLLRFSNQFLDISKIEEGKMLYNFVLADIVGIVEPEVEDARLIATRKNITVNMTTIPVPPVKADLEKVSQIVSNLLSNAIKYTQDGGTIDVNVVPSELGVRVSVRDSGVGISQEDLPRVFTKFYQAKNASKGSGKGTGIGLALVKALTEGHNGRVYVESTVGVGSTFIVEFPVGLEKANGREIALGKDLKQEMS